MGKGKLAKFADMERYANVFQYPYSVIDDVPFEMKGRWREMYFHNDNPIVLELGCGKGEYAVGLARLFPDVNFIGVDIKGARMWSGAKQALEEGIKNVAFLRTNIELIDRFADRWDWRELIDRHRDDLLNREFFERYKTYIPASELQHSRLWHNLVDERKLQLAREITV